MTNAGASQMVERKSIMGPVAIKQRTEKENAATLVSVIMPCYNAQDFVGAAIQSVLEQTWKNLELLVIDDGSRDSSRDILSQWAERDTRVQALINKQNMGVSKTRNRGIGLSKGRWIAFLDSDDVWEKDKLEKQLALAERQAAQFVFTAASVIDQHSKPLGTMSDLPERVAYQQLQRWNMITCSSVLLTREALGELCFEHDDSREDYLLWLRVLKRIDTAYCVTEPLVRYRVITGSRSANKVKMLRDTYRVHRHEKRGPIPSWLYTFSHFYHAFVHKYRHIKH